MPPQSLHYQSFPSFRTKLRYEHMALGAITGLFVTFPAIVIAIMYADPVRGHYVFARILFPVPMLFTRLSANSIGLPTMLLVATQFSIYGACIGPFATSRRNLILIVTAITIAHFIAIAICFSGALPMFSYLPTLRQFLPLVRTR